MTSSAVSGGQLRLDGQRSGPICSIAAAYAAKPVQGPETQSGAEEFAREQLRLLRHGGPQLHDPGVVAATVMRRVLHALPAHQRNRSSTSARDSNAFPVIDAPLKSRMRLSTTGT
jgi:hypothetical protein